MKKILIIFLLASCSEKKTRDFTGFEGKITYSINYLSHSPMIPEKSLTQYMGDRQEYYIKGGDYKSVLHGAILEWQLYINKENKIYSKLSNFPEIKEDDGSEDNDEVIKSAIRKNADTVLGYQCDELTLTSSSGVQKYYFSSKLPVDPSLYKKHKFGNWATYTRIAKAVPLKMIIQTEAFTVESVAIEISPQKLDASFFVPGSVKSKD